MDIIEERDQKSIILMILYDVKFVCRIVLGNYRERLQLYEKHKQFIQIVYNDNYALMAYGGGRVGGSLAGIQF